MTVHCPMCQTSKPSGDVVNCPTTMCRIVRFAATTSLKISEVMRSKKQVMDHAETCPKCGWRTDVGDGHGTLFCINFSCRVVSIQPEAEVRVMIL